MQMVFRSIMLLIAAGLMTAPGSAAPVPKSTDGTNTLSQSEITDGWLLLFDGETTFGWVPTANSDGKKPELSVKGGVLTLSGAGAAKQPATGMGAGIRFGTRFQYFQMTGEYRTTAKRAQFSATLAGDGNNAARITVGSELIPRTGNEWHKLSALFSPGKILMTTRPDADPSFSGPPLIPNARVEIRFNVSNATGGSVELRNLKLRPLGLKPLFNGKDLTGWKVFQDAKRAKSKFTVTDAGELHLTNGPGDLQTVNKYDNFVLQLECKTNGKALNSGVFFRCVPNQYQNGYEMQINNGYKNGDRTKPSDGGTGAIYRRMAARKIVANDHEWFTLTLIANGTHFATWVNGYQTADWTDTREPDDNPRKGRRTAAGHLSIQGHDPTTDILFRNIRIAELKEKK